MTRFIHGGGTGSIELSGTVLRIRWTRGILITEAGARTMMAQASELSAGQALPVLVEMAGVGGITPEAGSVFAKEWPPSRTAIVGDSPVDEVITAFYSARNKPASPTRFFASLTEAVNWLTERQAADTMTPCQPAQDDADQLPPGTP